MGGEQAHPRGPTERKTLSHLLNILKRQVLSKRVVQFKRRPKLSRSLQRDQTRGEHVPRKYTARGDTGLYNLYKVKGPGPLGGQVGPGPLGAVGKKKKKKKKERKEEKRGEKERKKRRKMEKRKKRGSLL